MRNSEFLLSSAKNDFPENGEIQFYDYCSPALISGEYLISTEQKITWTERNVSQSYSASQSFLVDGPRFSIDGALVYSVFPAAAATGQFESILPNIVLTRKTLPWERTCNDQPPTNPPVPWLGLMVLSEGEASGIISTTFGNVVNPGNGIYGPQNLNDVTALQLQSPCMAIDIPVATFNAIVPSEDDLRYLSHVREVDMAYKELRSDVEEGWFSVVIANRFPSPGKRNTVCLVSFEGFYDNLYGKTPVPNTYTSVRMAVLASWSFTGLAAQDENFSTLVQNLNSCSLRLPNQPAQQATEAEQLVAAAFHDGYNAMNYLTRFGETTAAWYRGPFTPVQLSAIEQDPFFSAEAGMIYDQQTGLFDLSYAASWQIGRLLALADKEFAVTLMNWRRSQKVEAQIQLEHARTAERLTGLVTFNASDNQRSRRTVTQQLREFMTGSFPQLAAPQSNDQKPLIRSADPTGFGNRMNQMPGMLTQQELIELLEQGPALRESLKQFLTNRMKA